MSNFKCPECGTEIIEGKGGHYVTFCPHYPMESKSMIRRKGIQKGKSQEQIQKELKEFDEKPKTTSKLEFYKRLLNHIEKLTLLYDDGKETHERAEEMLAKIYRYSHLAGSCKNPHEDWLKEFNESEEGLKDY